MTAKLGSCDFQIEIRRKQKTYHMNLLKKYNRLERCDQEAVVVNASVPAGGVSSATVVLDTVAAAAGVLIEENEPELSHVKIDLPRKGDKGATLTNDRYDKELDSEKRAVLKEGFAQREWMLTDKPGASSLVSHTVPFTSDVVRLKPYPLPFTTCEVLEKEVDDMLDISIIEPSTSPFSSPVVMVKKKDG